MSDVEHRRGRYLFALGLVVGLLVSGLVIPFVSGDRATEVASTGPTAADEQPEAGQPEPTDDGTGPAPVADAAVGESAQGAPAGTAQSGGTSTATPGAAPLQATAQGVSATEIKVGFVLLDLRAVNQIGLGGSVSGPPPEEVEKYTRFFIDEVNRSGGILGRKIAPTFTTFDPTNDSTARRACLALTEDAKVFTAVVAPGLIGDSILCFTEEHGVPTFEYSSEPDAWYRRSRGLLFTPAMSGSRNLRSLVAVLDANGSLKGKRIGVVSTDFPTEKLPVEEGLLPALKAAGYTVAHRSTLSQSTDQQPSQIPVEISQMRRANVDYIIWVSNAIAFTQWAQTASSQGYNPPYAMTDINSASNDFTVQTAPASIQAIAVTALRDGEQHAKMPEQEKDRACVARYAQATKTRVDRGSANYQQVTLACGWIELLAAAAKRAGANLTAQSLSQAMQSLGPWDFPFFSSGSFAAGKFDGADGVRLKVFEGGCKCWVPKGDFQPGARR